MSSAEQHAGQECPLLADEPFVVPDKVCVGKDGIECKEWEAVEVGVPRNGNVETGPFNFRRVNSDPNP